MTDFFLHLRYFVFLSSNSKTFYLGIFDGNLFIQSERYCFPELKFKKMYYVKSTFLKLWGLKIGIINVRQRRNNAFQTEWRLVVLSTH